MEPPNGFLITLAAALHAASFLTATPLLPPLRHKGFPAPAMTNLLMGFFVFLPPVLPFVAPAALTQTGLALEFAFPVLPLL
jgi:hypothetical protein